MLTLLLAGELLLLLLLGFLILLVLRVSAHLCVVDPDTLPPAALAVSPPDGFPPMPHPSELREDATDTIGTFHGAAQWK